MSHHNTLFSQNAIVHPQTCFPETRIRHKTGRSSRNFGFKEQFTVMAFIQLAARRFMRDGLRCLEAAGSRLYHWGLKNVARSTFADANNSRLSPKTIADIYKERWKIEFFFKEIKQNLRIKNFVGSSENAVMIPIYTALTVYLLLIYQKFLSRLGLSVQQLLQLIQINLLGTASLDELLNPRPRKNKQFL